MDYNIVFHTTTQCNPHTTLHNYTFIAAWFNCLDNEHEKTIPLPDRRHRILPTRKCAGIVWRPWDRTSWIRRHNGQWWQTGDSTSSDQWL